MPVGEAKLASHYYSHGNSGAIKRGCEDVENENEDDLVTSISSSTGGCSRRSPPKKPKFVVTSEEMNEYFNLLHQNEIQLFLQRDACCLISDKVNLKERMESLIAPNNSIIIIFINQFCKD